MATIQEDLTKVKELVEQAKSILVVTHKKTTMDSVGSALSMYLGLTALGKTVTVASPDPMTVEFSSFVGANKWTNEVGKKNFIISLDYQEGSIEKVSYNIENNKFNLVIEPRPGFDFSADKAHYQHAGVEADLIIAVDTVSLGDLGDLYELNKDAFASKPIIVIDSHKENTKFGQLNIVDASPVTVELIAVVLSSLGIKLTEDLATNMFNALLASTNNFQIDGVTGRTFEVAAVCMKAGAKRFLKQVEQKKSEEIVVGETVVTPNAEAKNDDWLKPKIFKGPVTG